jgi:hypothetical protein
VAAGAVWAKTLVEASKSAVQVINLNMPLSLSRGFDSPIICMSYLQ